MARKVLEHLAEMRARNPELQVEYERLGPRFAVIDQLIEARQRAHLTQRELAARLGVSQAVIGRLEGGKHSPRIDTLAQVAAALGCELDVRVRRRRKAVA